MNGALYRSIWRWHFYAGLFVIPMILVLSLTGATYLFKPQIDRWEERAFQALPAAGQVSPAAQVASALAAYRGSQFAGYRMPESPGDAAMIRVTNANGPRLREVFVSPQGRVLGSLRPDERVTAFIKRLHGQLLLGRQGSWLVELAASWAIVLILSGLYLWWPRGRWLAGVVWPRLSSGGLVFLRDLHAVTGFWVSGLALLLLTSGLPWADVWGSAFKAVRQEMGWTKSAPDWTIGGRPDSVTPSTDHDHSAMLASVHAVVIAQNGGLLDTMVARAATQKLAFPVFIIPPGAPEGEGGSGKPSKGWLIKSETQNRPLRTTLRYDASGLMLAKDSFAKRHPIDRMVAYGTAWHEGQLFGWINQFIGLATALMLITLASSGFILWRRRKPADLLGAPRPLRAPVNMGGIAILLLVQCALLPMLAASLVILWLIERLILRRISPVAAWLGLTSDLS